MGKTPINADADGCARTIVSTLFKRGWWCYLGGGFPTTCILEVTDGKEDGTDKHDGGRMRVRGHGRDAAPRRNHEPALWGGHYPSTGVIEIIDDKEDDAAERDR